VKIRLKFVQHWVDQKTGNAYAFLRRPGFPRIRLPGVPGSAEFLAGYHAALRGEAPAPAAEVVRTGQNTIAAAIARYIEEALPKRVKGVTLGRQSSTLRKFAAVDGVGTSPLSVLDRKYIDRNIADAETVGIARTWLITVREFAKWAVTQELLAADPTAGIVLRLPKSDGHATWSEEQIAQFEARWPIGTRERLLFSLLIYTGQRCSDVLKLGRHSIVDGAFHVKQQKTGVEVWVQVHRELKPVLAAHNVVGIHTDTFLHNTRGERLDQRDLNKMFRDACREAGLPDTCVPHGLRKAFCRRLADIGTPPHEIAALSGHLTLKEVMRYTAAYDRRQAGKRAMAKLEAA
jgi:integrase